MKKFFKSPWTISLITALFSFGLTIVYDLSKGEKIFNTLLYVISTIWQCIIYILNINLKLWWIFVGIIVFAFTVLMIFRIQGSDCDEPFFLQYTNDTIQDWHWEWSWDKNYEGRYEVSNLHPVCDRCGAPLVRKGYYDNSFYCVRCGKTHEGIDFPNLDHIKLYIYDTVKRENRLNTK